MIDGIPNRPLYVYRKDIIDPKWINMFFPHNKSAEFSNAGEGWRIGGRLQVQVGHSGRLRSSKTQGMSDFKKGEVPEVPGKANEDLHGTKQLFVVSKEMQGSRVPVIVP